MILKKLEIQGFKSFADRTEVVFTPGVTAIVGPNGSGKSNISDAILWVLGEQNIRNIRGNKSQDVIFAGTDKRKPVGMAEVSLTIDNTSGKLPLEFAEITITRRAYRSGESEFFINRVPCRLKDIYELFLDTGVGRGAYSIVSQGELDAILSARPEDRRMLFDEAAGINKYRHRKKEAERKLTNTEENLNRINDIIYELQSQIEPMAEQAELARKYIELMSRLKDIEVGILVRDLRRYNAEIQSVRNAKDLDTSAIEKLDLVLAELEAKKASATQSAATAEADFEHAQLIYQQLTSTIQKTSSQLSLVKQRYESILGSESSISSEITQLRDKIDNLVHSREELISDVETIRHEENEISSGLAEKMIAAQALKDEITSKSKVMDDQKSNYIELAKRLATQRNELANLVQRIESLKALLAKRTVELTNTQETINGLQTEIDDIRNRIILLKSKKSEYESSMDAAQKDLKAIQDNINKSSGELTQIKHRIVERQTRLKTLQEMDESKEGYFQGVRSVSSAIKAGKLVGEYAIVADVIKVPKGYETAYEIALGSSLQDIITNSDTEAKLAVEYLKRNHAGRATFLPLNMMRHSSSPMLKEMVGKNGIIGIGSELVEYDRRYAPAIESLLARVLIAHDIDSAIAASKTIMGWSKIVTIDGELISPSGAITGGRSNTKTTNILGRKQEIDSLKSELTGLTVSLRNTQNNLQKLETNETAVKEQIAAIEQSRSLLEKEMVENERHLEFSIHELARLQSELNSLEIEQSTIRNDLSEAERKQLLLKESLDSSDKENATLDDFILHTEQEIQKLRSQYDSIIAEINTLNVRLEGATQKRSGFEKMIHNLDISIKEMNEEIGQKQSQLANVDANKSKMLSQIDELQTQLLELNNKCEKTRIETEKYKQLKQEIQQSMRDINEQIMSNTRNKDEISQRLHNAEIKETRLDMMISQTIVRLLDEYDVSAEEALNINITSELDGSGAEVSRLKREIKAMGEVNTGALQEYARIKERYDFLTNQRQDLIESREKLLDAIHEIDLNTRGIFLDTFKAVDEAFRVMFIRLFNGGDTELILTDPNNIQETGIEVIVEMPGKKRQNLLLLSGGERALTASALMFALMMVRPSPFCVMDEIDAPLDEANVERFAQVIREFAERSQMIVITHNRATMEAADILYGVTMQEPGVSKLLSVKLKDYIDASAN